MLKKRRGERMKQMQSCSWRVHMNYCSSVQLSIWICKSGGIIVLIDCWLTWGNQRQNAEECTSHRSFSVNLPDFPDSPYYASCKTLFSSVLQNFPTHFIFSVQNFSIIFSKNLTVASLVLPRPLVSWPSSWDLPVFCLNKIYKYLKIQVNFNQC